MNKLIGRVRTAGWGQGEKCAGERERRVRTQAPFGWREPIERRSPYDTLRQVSTDT